MGYPDIALRVLGLIGVQSLAASDNANSLNQPGVTTSDIDAAAQAITNGARDLFRQLPKTQLEQRYSDVLRPPEAVTLTVTQYSKTISAVTTYASWMEGCTIRITGDDLDNELVSSTELLRPHMGSSGSVSATVYGDALKLPAAVGNVLPSVEMPDVGQLVNAGDRDSFSLYNNSYAGAYQPERGMPPSSYYTTINRTTQQPVSCLIETRYSSTGAATFLRVNPMPDRAYPITIRSTLKPPTVAVNDIMGDTMVVSGTLSPDATGTYVRQGDYNGFALYMRQYASPFDFVIYNGGGAWYISTTGSPQWATASTTSLSPVGSYAAIGPATGTATVAAGYTGNTTVPVDEALLTIFAKKHFLSHPAFSNASAAAQVQEQYRIACESLMDMIPMVDSGMATYR